MSRIIVKNLPKNISAKKLENLFSSKGQITDLNLKYTKEGVFRQFAFVGYKTEVEAQAAKDYFNNTFVNTSRVTVDICSDLNDPNKPQSWKQKVNEAKTKKANFEKEKNDNTDVTTKKKSGRGVIPEELLKDAKFKEFLEVNKDRKSKPVWAEDVDVGDSELDDGGSSSDSDYDQNYKEHSESETEKGKIEEPEKTSIILESISDTKEDEKKKASLPKKEKEFDDSFTVKVRNLPFSCKKKSVKQLFQGLKIESLRFPPKSKGFAYVKFKTEKDMKQALNKHKGFLDGHRIDVVKYQKKLGEMKQENSQNKNSKEEDMESLAETGRIYIRNLCFTVTESEVEQLFSKYGPLAEVHLPIDFLTKRAQGFAFVSFVFAEHAVKAFTELDGTTFQGRLLHLIPAKPKKEYELDENDSNYKKKKEAKMKQLSESSHNWNILFLGMNAVADVIAEKYNVEKSKLLSGDSKESVAVRMALAETEMVIESRKFLLENGVQLDAFSQPNAPRSKSVIIAKHLPPKTTAEELSEKFSAFGALTKVILPPSGLVALVEFDNPTEAKSAFRRLAYSRFHNLPLYLEWAPVDALKEPPTVVPVEESPFNITKNTSEKEKEESQADDEGSPDGTTVFVKNINFATNQEDFQKHFSKCGPLISVEITTKKNLKSGKMLSMGFGFVQYKNRESAVKALQNLQHKQLDGHALELKFANRETKHSSATQKKKYEVKKQLSTKILVRNIPFQAAEDEIRELFKQFGLLKSARLPKKLDGSGEHRGFGFVEFYSKDNAERAFNAMCHSTHFYGRRLVLEWANTDSNDVDELRKKTARDFVHEEPIKKVKKRKLNEDVALAAASLEAEDDE